MNSNGFASAFASQGAGTGVFGIQGNAFNSTRNFNGAGNGNVFSQGAASNQLGFNNSINNNNSGGNGNNQGVFGVSAFDNSSYHGNRSSINNVNINRTAVFDATGNVIGGSTMSQRGGRGRGRGNGSHPRGDRGGGRGGSGSHRGSANKTYIPSGSMSTQSAFGALSSTPLSSTGFGVQAKEKRNHDAIGARSPAHDNSLNSSRLSGAVDSSSRLQGLDASEDADSRLARFSAVPVGNRYEEFKEERVKEREDAIKRGDIPDPNKRGHLKDAITFVGTCRDMCPEFERHEREYQKNIEKFETIPGTEYIDHSRAVKAYARPAAGVEQPLPSDVRPPDVLLSTLDYLMTKIVAQGDLSDSHAFVRDRTRSIRQDFTLQNSRGVEAVQAHEIIARYHILCMHQLCENKGFSEQQEMEQLRKVLTSLQEFYNDMRTENIPCPNEAEFRAYHILSHLSDPDMIRQAQLLPPHIFMDPYIQNAVEMHALSRRNNDVRRRAKVQSEASPNFFSRFFKMIAGPKTSYLMACLLETNFGEIRKGALKALNKSYYDQHDGFPVKDLVNILAFDDEQECIANCEEYDLALTHYGQPAVVFGRKDNTTRRRIFKEATIKIKQHRNERVVEAKRQNYSTLQIIYGEAPGPQRYGVNVTNPQSVAPPAKRPQEITNLARGQLPTSFDSRLGTSRSNATSLGVFTSGSSTFTAMKSMGQTATSKPTVVFDFGLNQSTGSTAAAAAAAAGLNRSQPIASSEATESIKTRQSAIMAPASSTQTIAPFSAPTLPFSAPTLPFSAPTVPSSVQQPFSFTNANVLASVGVSQGTSAAQPQPSLITPIKPQSVFSIEPPPPSKPQLVFPIEPPTSKPLNPSIKSPLQSDATKLVTKRGKAYPRSMIESFTTELLEQETDRILHLIVAQVLQGLVVERSLQRAKEREMTISQVSEWLIVNVMNQVTGSITEDILAELYRETKLQRWVISRWKEFTTKSRRRAEELRKRQEHFLANVRAMDSRAGLLDGHPLATKIRNYSAKQKLLHPDLTSEDSEDLTNSLISSMAKKRKRLLGIDTEPNTDSVLMARLKKVMEPKREMWAPLPVLDIVSSCSHYSPSTCAQLQQLQQQSQSLTGVPKVGEARTEQQWRLFVNTPTFKEMSSKWLLTKLGIDMGRHTRVQQRSGVMNAIHHGQNPKSEKTMNVVVCGIEDQSVGSLLGLSEQAISETAAFIFEFSKIPFAVCDTFDESAIRQYWLSERERLVRFLSCFPKVKQPIVFVLWTENSEMWERISPRMTMYLELNRMVASPEGPLLCYNFLNLNMSNMVLDPYIIGSLEWLAAVSKNNIERGHGLSDPDPKERMEIDLPLPLSLQS